jgi:sugar phosphate isomerase/epimerase
MVDDSAILAKRRAGRNRDVASAAVDSGSIAMRLGLVTYMWGAEWDLPTLLKNCEATGFEGVELRSTHKHGVEPSLSAEARAEVRKRFHDSPVKFLGPGSACEYHSPDHGVVKNNIDLTKKFVELSADLGGTGVKVRPNALVKGEPEETTIARIAAALHEAAPAGDPCRGARAGHIEAGSDAEDPRAGRSFARRRLLERESR